MEKTLYLLSNAHIDPVWQWEWEEGAAAALSTFRCAADFCEEFDGYIFNHNEALLYRWVEEYEPALFKRIQHLVKAGRWHIMGGWFLQPDCNLPSGEAFVRQIQAGRLYFQQKFGVTPTTAINFDPFGHSRGLVQILKKSGFDSYLFCRPGEDRLHLPEGPFVWVGCDGSTLLAQRLPEYGSALGKAAEKIQTYLATRRTAAAYDACLWGVGDHGGGASRQDLAAIAALKEECAAQDVTLLHATPEDFFARVKAEQATLVAAGEGLPRHAGDLNPWAPGCYTSQIRVKQKYRQLENELFSTEKMAAAAAGAGVPWPAQQLAQATDDLLTAQFHDSLPGSSIQPVEEMVLRKLDHALEETSRIKARAFFALMQGQPAAAADRIPILVYNPHPWPVEGDFSCEMMLWDQNWEENFSQPTVWQAGRALPTQCEKEASNLPLDWRKRVTFHATLAPMQMNRFDCGFTRIPQKPQPDQGSGPALRFETPLLTAEIDRTTGALTRYTVAGREYLAGGCVLEVVDDNADPWGMTVDRFTDTLGVFAPMDPAQAAAFCGTDTPLAPVRVVEQGDVRTVVEVLLCWGHSRAVVRYLFSQASAAVEIEVRVQWAETHKMLKLRLPSALAAPRLLGQVAFGEEELPATGRENVAQRYAALTDGTNALTVLNDGTYGLAAKDGVLWLSLLRSAAYTAHPIGERKILPQDRYTPHIEQGERLYRFALLGGPAAAVLPGAGRRADIFGERPMALSAFPAGDGAATLPPFLTLTGDDAVQMTTLKQAADGDGLILRLFDPTADGRSVTLQGAGLAAPLTVTLAPFEVVTLRLRDGVATPCDLMEQPLT